MIKLNPKYEEFFYERIINFLSILHEKLKNKYEPKGLSQDLVDIEVYHVFKYLTDKDYDRPVHNFSVGLLDHIRNSIIIPIIDGMYKDLTITKVTKNKLTDYALDLFVIDCLKYNFANLDDLETNEKYLE